MSVTRNYLPTTTAGDTHRRSPVVNGSNILGKTPVITYQEEDVVYDSTGKPFHSFAGSVSKVLDAPDTEFNLIDPTDGTTVIGTAKHQDVYVMLYSLYRSIAAERDAAETPPS